MPSCTRSLTKSSWKSGQTQQDQVQDHGDDDVWQPEEHVVRDLQNDSKQGISEGQNW